MGIELFELARKPSPQLPGRAFQCCRDVRCIVVGGDRPEPARARLDRTADMRRPVLVGVLILKVHLDARELVAEKSQIALNRRLDDFDHAFIALDDVVRVHLYLHHDFPMQFASNLQL